MCYDRRSHSKSGCIAGRQQIETHLVLELNPARERARRRVVVFHVFCRSPLIPLALAFRFIFARVWVFASPITYVNPISSTERTKKIYSDGYSAQRYYV
jgi:hypothetical protein